MAACVLALVLLLEHSYEGLIYLPVNQKDVGRITDLIAQRFCHALGMQETKTSLWPKKALLLTDSEALLDIYLLPLGGIQGELGKNLMFVVFFLFGARTKIQAYQN